MHRGRHSDLAGNIAAVVPMSYGDPDAAFTGAAHVFEEEIFLHRGGAMTLEGRAVLASYDAAADVLTVWSATQTPHLCRGTLADLFERDLESIRGDRAVRRQWLRHQGAVLRRGGGDPGRRHEASAPGEMAGGPARAFSHRHAGARPILDGGDRGRRGGKILGLRGTMLHDTGAFLPWGIIVPYIAATTFPGPYVVPAYKIETTVVLTNRSRPRWCAAPAGRRRYSPWNG